MRPYNVSMEATTPLVRRAALLVGTLVAASGIGTLVAPTPAGAVSLPPSVTLVTRNANGDVANASANELSLSGNGRFVAFTSGADNLVADDTNDRIDVFVKDRWSQEIERVSVSTSGAQLDGLNDTPSISDDGRYVAFRSTAPGLIPGDDQGRADIFVRDRLKGTTTWANPGTGGALANAASFEPHLSGNGRYLAFVTAASNVVAADSNGVADVFVRDLQAKTTDRASISIFEAQAATGGHAPSISDDGRYVAFASTSLLAGGSNVFNNVFVRDRTAGTTMLASLSSAEEVADAVSDAPVISGNGRYVAFESAATNLTTGDTFGRTIVYRRDLTDGVTTRVGISSTNSVLQGDSRTRAISDDGNAILFATSAVATAETDGGNDIDLFVRTIANATTRRVSSTAAALDPQGYRSGGSLSDDGGAAAFASEGAMTTDVVTNQGYVDDRMNIGPFLTTDAFITRQFQDFLGRTPTAGELDGWRVRLERGQATPSSLIASLADTVAFSGKRAPVVRLYWAFFLRKPDPSGLSYWIGKYQAGTSLSAIAQKFSQSSEFKSRYGSVSNQQYVKLVYVNVFERQPDPSGLSYWTGKLDRKELNRGTVLIGFSESSEGTRRLAPQVYITLISQGMLGASPSAAFWDAAFPTYKAGEKELAWLAQQTLLSIPYKTRVA